MSYGIINFAKDAVTGQLEYVPADVARQRLDICESCEFFSKLRACKKCGCFMDVKTTLVNAECPIGKWGTFAK